jgi:hypothetical protein
MYLVDEYQTEYNFKKEKKVSFLAKKVKMQFQSAFSLIKEQNSDDFFLPLSHFNRALDDVTPSFFLFPRFFSKALFKLTIL